MTTDQLIEENPIRLCRKELHMTQARFAREAEIHESAVLLNEQGCYPEILPAILEYLVNQGYDPKQLQRDYQLFVTHCRSTRREELNFPEFILGPQDVRHSPIEQLYKWTNTNRTKLAKLLCVQPALLYKLERGELSHLPSHVELALREIGMPNVILLQMNERQDEFSQWLKANR